MFRYYVIKGFIDYDSDRGFNLGYCLSTLYRLGKGNLLLVERSGSTLELQLHGIDFVSPSCGAPFAQ